MIDIRHGDCLEVLATLPENSIDACVTDPPYGLGTVKDVAGLMTEWLNDRDGHEHVGGAGFMGRDWDRSVPSPRMWRELYRVLKPGACALVFAGSRTSDLMGLSLRLAGFELVDSIFWCFGAGFPKGADVGKMIEKLTAPATPDAQLWDGYRSQLKPAHEPILVCRKPLEGTIAQNALKWGTAGAFNIEACRVGMGDDRASGGRYPANLILQHAHDCDENGCGCSCPVKLMGEQSGESKSRHDGISKWAYDSSGGSVYGKDYRIRPAWGHGDTGTAARYFTQINPDPFIYSGKATKKDRTCNGAVTNPHPTVKPRALIKHLLKLIMPPSPNAVVIDPFGGSGTTGVAAKELGRNAILIEREAEYVELIRDRVDATDEPAIEQIPLFKP
jgi:site-specific DNA-methyltransferase (adenine-specific)